MSYGYSQGPIYNLELTPICSKRSHIMEQDALSGERVIPQDHGSMFYLLLHFKWHISEEGKKDIIFYLF